MTPEVRIWRIPLDVALAHRQRMAAVLSDAERERMARFATSKLRARYAVRRGALRHILGHALGISPAALAFVHGPTGKPALAATHQGTWLEFSVSHSADTALIAVSEGGRVGIDVERIHTSIDVPCLAKTICAPCEARLVLGLPEPARVRAFLGVWTRKEAYLKGTGEGLSAPAEEVVCTVPPVAPRLLATPGDTMAPVRWSLTELTLADCVATLAFEGPEPLVDWRVWRFPRV
jgi:4'-phosphopantetheinyl transferase